MSIEVNGDDFFDLLCDYNDLLADLPDWKQRPLTEHRSKTVVKQIIRNLSLSRVEKVVLYKKILKTEICWIEFFSRCGSNRLDILFLMNNFSSLFMHYPSRSFPAVIKGINGMMKPVSYNSFITFKHNISKLKNLELGSLSYYEDFELTYIPLPANFAGDIHGARVYYKTVNKNAIDFSIEIDPNC